MSVLRERFQKFEPAGFELPHLCVAADAIEHALSTMFRGRSGFDIGCPPAYSQLRLCAEKAKSPPGESSPCTRRMSCTRSSCENALRMFHGPKMKSKLSG